MFYTNKITDMNFKPYYEQLENIHVNVLPNRSYYVPSSVEYPCDIMEDSENVTMLSDNDWLFKLYENPFVVEKFFDEEFEEGENYDRIPVPSCWQILGYDQHAYQNVRLPYPYDPPYVPNENPSGAYIKYFYMTEEQVAKKNYLNFEGVDSCYYVWVNGEFVGYSQVSHSTSEFDISDFLREGENKLSVLVLKWCSGSYLEDQDKLRMSGIFRDTYIITRSENHIRDFYVKTPLTNDYKDAKINLCAEWNGTAKQATVTLLDPNEQVMETKELADGKVSFDVPNATLWNAENPQQYTLIIATDDESIVQKVGVRAFEVKGNLFLVNGVKVKFKGVNRHDSDPFTGYVIDRGQLLSDLSIMKQNNVNAIRTSHYPNAPWATQLYSELGFYVINESDIETHGTITIYGGGHVYSYDSEFKEDKTFGALCHDVRYEESFVDRIRRNVQRDKNNACVVMWSLGNESGYGPNMEKAAAWIKEFDKEMLVHYESSIYQLIGYNNDISNIDVYSRMYAPTEAIEEYMNGGIDIPFVQCEFVHAMGNGPGDIEDYMEQMYKYDGFCGGFVWEWCDHAVYMGKTAEGRDKYFYGGDWGEFPHEGNFCMDGLVYPNRKPHTGLLEWRNCVRPARAYAVDMENGIVKIQNKLDFTNLQDAITAYYEVSLNGDVVEVGTVDDLDIEAHCEKDIKINYTVPADGDVRLRIVYLQKDETFLVPQGSELGFDQLVVREAEHVEAVPVKGEFCVTEDDIAVVITGDKFKYTFNKLRGTFEKMVKDNVTILDMPIEYNIWRAPTDNDRNIRVEWEKAGYDRQTIRTYNTTVTEADGVVTIENELAISAVYIQHIVDVKTVWTVDGKGSVKVDIKGKRNKDLPHLPRFGLRMFLPMDFTSCDYLGYGPYESYIDKRRASYYARFVDSVENMHEDYIKPQENGSHWNCKEVNVVDVDGYTVTAKGDGFSFNISEYSQEDLANTAHNFELDKSGFTVLCLDARMSGIGSGSCGPQLKEKYQVNEEVLDFTFDLSFGK